MVLKSNFSLHLETIKRDAPNIFDDKGYDTILSAAKILFGDRNVTYTESEILIKDSICLRLSLSWNEQKVYISTYHDLRMMKGEQLENSSDINNELFKINPYFRLFGIDQVVEYLQMKEIENRFIKQNEG